MIRALLFLLLTASLQAQTHHYVNMRLAGNRHMVLDEFQSPLVYRGLEGFLSGGWEMRSEKIRLRTEVGGSFGLLSPSGPLIYQGGGNGEVSLLFNLGGVGPERVLVGPSLTGGFYYRYRDDYRNNASSYDGLFALGPQAGYERDLGLWKQEFRLGAEVFLPLLLLSERPEYIRAFPDGEWPAPKVYGPGQALLFRTKLYADWLRNNGNIIRLIYGWEYRQLTEVNPLYASRHFIGLETFFHL